MVYRQLARDSCIISSKVELLRHVSGFYGAIANRQGQIFLLPMGTLFWMKFGGACHLEVHGSLLSSEFKIKKSKRWVRDQIRKGMCELFAATTTSGTEVAEQSFFVRLICIRLACFSYKSASVVRDRQGDFLLLAGFFAERFRRQLALQATNVIAIINQSARNLHCLVTSES